MRRVHTILALAVASACLLSTATRAQSRPGASAPKSASEVSVKKHAATLLKIARDLRKSGQPDVAAKIEAQANRLVRGTAADPNPWRRSGAPATKWKPSDTPRAARPQRGVPRPDTAPRPDRPSPAPRNRPRLPSGVRADPRPVESAPLPGIGRPVTPPRRVRAPAGEPPAALPPSGGWSRNAPRPSNPVASPPGGGWSRNAPRPSTPAASPRRARAPGRSATLPSRGRMVPLGRGENIDRIPQDRPQPDEARVDLGRNRVRYQPVPTRRNAAGRVEWQGLPVDPRATGGSAPSNTSGRVAPARRSNLEKRVQTLSEEVREMRRLLDRLNEQLGKRREALIR